ncbi:MAG: cation diffusion facilitator family transporter [Cytophagales bacterium]
MHKIASPIHDHSHSHDHSHENTTQIGKFQYKTALVVAITFVTMVAEIGFGYASNSLALLADGWHMSSHVLALGMTWFAYFLAKKFSKQGDINQSSKKILSLSGYTSAIILLVVAVIMAVESFDRLLNPERIAFKEAIFVSIIGLIVNGLSAFLLHDGHQHHDHNIKAAYLHVLADTITSLAAIISLGIGMYFNILYLDALSAIVSSIIIANWAISLAWTSGKELIGYFRN